MKGHQRLKDNIFRELRKTKFRLYKIIHIWRDFFLSVNYILCLLLTRSLHPDDKELQKTSNKL